jgi:hypothetical protein
MEPTGQHRRPKQEVQDASAKGSRRVADAIRRSSYRNCFLQYPLARPLWEVPGRQKIDRHSEQLLQCDLQSPQVKEGRSRQWIDENVDVTGFRIFPA